MKLFFLRKLLVLIMALHLSFISFGLEKSDENENLMLNFKIFFFEGIKAKILGDYYKASSYFNACLEIDRNSAAVMYELANVYFLNGDYTSAELLAMRAHDLKPDNYWYKNLLAQIYYYNGNYNGAISLFDKLIKKYPNNLNFLESQAANYILAQRYEEAIKTYTKIENKIGIEPAISQDKYEIYLLMGNKKEAYKEIEKLIRAFPDSISFKIMLADLYSNDNQDEMALETYQNIIDENTNNPFAHLSLADYYYNKGEIEKALEEIKTAFNTNSINVSNKITIILKLIRDEETIGLYKEEIHLLIKLLQEKYPDELNVHLLYGNFLLVEKKYKEARKTLKKALELDGANVSVWEQVIFCSSQLKDFNDIYEVSNKAIELFPHQISLYLYNGYAASQIKKYNEAIDILKKGIEIFENNDPQKINLYNNLAEVYYSKKDYRETFKLYNQILKLDPNNLMALNNYSYYLSEIDKDLHTAEQMSGKTISIDPNNFTYLDTYAWILFKQKKYKEALFIIKSAMENGGNNSEVIIEHLGDILYENGETDEALKNWKKSYELGNESQILKQKIEKKTYIKSDIPNIE